MLGRSEHRRLTIGSLCIGAVAFCSFLWAPTVASQPNSTSSTLLSPPPQAPVGAKAPVSLVNFDQEGRDMLCMAAGREDYVALIRAQAERNALPSAVAEAVTYVESRYRPGKIGKVGEVGLMQIRPATAATLGFRGHYLELADPATNITYGVAYLARAWRLADGDLCRALMKYRAGHRQERMSPLSKKYCALAKAYLEANGLDDPTSDRLSHATTQLATR